MFCPECETKCITVVDKFYACYDCPECLVHWSYVDGSYHLSPDDDCWNCKEVEV